MTATQLANIGHLLDLTDYAVEFVGDYDMDAVRADYVAAINDQVLLASVTVYASGDVLAAVASADEARAIDWKAVADAIDVQPIFERHDITQFIRRVPAADGHGDIVCEAHDHTGGLIVAWGPATRDEYDAPIDDLDDAHWIGTGGSRTETGTRAEIEQWAYDIIKTATRDHRLAVTR